MARQVIVFALVSLTIFMFTGCGPGNNTETDTPMEIYLQTGAPLFQSNLTWGITITQYYEWYEYGNTEAMQQAKNLLKSISSIYNIHIMGWGAGNPWPAKSDAINFHDIRSRVNLAKTLGGEPWITFCTAPGWMKGAGDWSMERAPRPEFEDDFAYLCAEIAKEFTDVKVFQVWNEFKGMWVSGKLDYERYTRLYNKVYTAVKTVRPDALIGGFYAVLEGDGTQTAFGGLDINQHTAEPLIDDSKTAITYYLNNAISSDLFLADRANVDYHNDGYWNFQTSQFRATRDQAMLLTKYFRKATSELTELTHLPVVWSEYYGTYGDDNSEFMPMNQPYIGAHYASIMYNMIMGAAGRDIYALLWLEKEADIRHALFTDTTASNGGQATPHYYAMKKLIDNFPKGTELFCANISSPGIAQNDIGNYAEALISEKAVYVINKTNTQLMLTMNDRHYTLNPYAVEVFEQGKNP